MNYYLANVAYTVADFEDFSSLNGSCKDLMTGGTALWAASSEESLDDHTLILKFYLEAMNDSRFAPNSEVVKLSSTSIGELNEKLLLDLALNGGAEEVYMHIDSPNALVRKIYKVSEVDKETYINLLNLEIPELFTEFD